MITTTATICTIFTVSGNDKIVTGMGFYCMTICAGPQNINSFHYHIMKETNNTNYVRLQIWNYDSRLHEF
jgi:hypothetical protein